MEVKYSNIRYTALSLADIAEFFEKRAQALRTARISLLDQGQIEAFEFAAEVLHKCTLVKRHKKAKPAKALKGRIVKVKSWITKTGRKVKATTRRLPALAQDKPVKVKKHIKHRNGKPVPTRKHTRANRGEGTNTHPQEAQA